MRYIHLTKLKLKKKKYNEIIDETKELRIFLEHLRFPKIK